jgi:integrase
MCSGVGRFNGGIGAKASHSATFRIAKLVRPRTSKLPTLARRMIADAITSVRGSALPYSDLPEFMAALKEQDGVAARALEFVILTAARTGEVLGATWGEIDLIEKTWTIPAERMKAGRVHRVPLSDHALGILNGMRPLKSSDFVFPSSNGKPLSNMALNMLLRRMRRDAITVHGFRSTFRDWCAEQTSFAPEVAEMTLAHSVGDKVEAAYRRGDLFAKRRELADAWSGFAMRS